METYIQCFRSAGKETHPSVYLGKHVPLGTAQSKKQLSDLYQTS